MTGISSRDQCTPYHWGKGGVGWPLIKSVAFEVKEEELACGCAEKRRKHEHASQSYYILSGTAEVETEEKTANLSVGECFFIPGGPVQKIANKSDTSLRLFVVSVPPVSVDRIDLE